MAITTFSGPIKSGTVREGASENLGFTLMSQSAVIDIIGATNTTTIGIIPANSQIVDAILNVTTVSNDTGTGTVIIGTAADDNAFMSSTNVKALGVTHTGGTTALANDIGTSDTAVTATYTAGNADGATGVATVTILYMQNNNLS
tara:strand:- start:122 stop:556 length:435 start_codon:yes stop_codon:yes gene_type:complete